MAHHCLDSSLNAGHPIPYAHATARQRALALTGIQQHVAQRFALLPALVWARELDALQPDLWAEQEHITLSYGDLATLTERVWCAPEMSARQLPLSSLQSLYLARHLAQYAHNAHLALSRAGEQPTDVRFSYARPQWEAGRRQASGS